MGRFRKLIVYIALVAFALLMLWLGWDNAHMVPLRFMEWRTPAMPVFHWVAFSLLIGALVGFSLAGGFGISRRLEARRMRRELEASQREIRELRQIALED